MHLQTRMLDTTRQARTLQRRMVSLEREAQSISKGQIKDPGNREVDLLQMEGAQEMEEEKGREGEGDRTRIKTCDAPGPAPRD